MNAPKWTASYVEDGWTSPPIEFPTETAAFDYVKGINLLSGKSAASRRIWIVAELVPPTTAQ